MRRPLRLQLLPALAIACSLALPALAAAQQRVVTLRYVPTARAQIALWIERPDGTFMGTVRLTESVARRGIGNRPGATQMNSGFRWPYGRREGVLPVWAHRRAAAADAAQFRRVIFQDRASEGYASRTSSDQSRDDYFCLSFNLATTSRDALDAVTCASIFNSDKGRYVTAADVDANYSEPYVTNGSEAPRPMIVTSLYPPRRDVTGSGANDHPDVASFNADALAVMPQLDAVSMATAAEGVAQTITFTFPDSWPDGEYVAFLEVHTEGDYNDVFSDSTYPTPNSPSWDYWAINYGYPYRGQPSVVFRLDFETGVGGRVATRTPVGYGALHGEDGELHVMDAKITNDAGGAPGSGADRLYERDGARFSLEVLATDVCAGEDPPPECDAECGPTSPCPTGFLCGDLGTCIGICDSAPAPPPVEGLVLIPDERESESHHFATISFTTPEWSRPVSEYRVRVSTTPFDMNDPDSFDRGVAARRATLADEGLEVCDPECPGPEETVTLGIGHLLPATTSYVAIRAVSCGREGAIATAEITTTEQNFTTVSPCFVATAAYGSPLAEEIGVFRRFRDRHLMTNALGRALVGAYYEHGPVAARWLEAHPRVRAVTRGALTALAGMLQDEPR